MKLWLLQRKVYQRPCSETGLTWFESLDLFGVMILKSSQVIGLVGTLYQKQMQTMIYGPTI